MNTAHNLKISDILKVLKTFPKECTHVDAIVVDEYTIRFVPSEQQDEEITDVNQLII